MEQHEEFAEFSLLGGPFHRLGCRLGLVREGGNTIALGLALGVFLWAILLLLAFIEGTDRQILSFSVIGVHMRLLVAIPLFFLCETRLDPEMGAFVRGMVRSRIVPETALPALDSQIAYTARWREAWLPEIMCLLAAALLLFVAPHKHLMGITVARELLPVGDEMTFTSGWYWLVCMTLFRFLLFRWLWRLGLWWRFLWRVSRLELNLVPTHPDGVAGLGYLEVVHGEFAFLVLAISAVQSASFAEAISAGTMKTAVVYPEFVLNLILYLALFLGPLLIFTAKLHKCRVQGLRDYMVLGAHYVSEFDKKWLGPSAAGRPLLGTPDVRSLADLAKSVRVVRDMRLIPASRRMLIAIAVVALLPMLPLFLLEYPVDALTRSLVRKLFGL